MRPLARRPVLWIALVVVALMAWDVGGALGVPRTTTPADEANLPAHGPIFLLYMGSDARPGTPALRGRSDVMLLVGINAAKRRATILGFHRDTWVKIHGHGHNRINAGLAFGGPLLAEHTVTAVTGIPVNAWLVTTFTGFTGMVDAIGGIDVDVPLPLYDPFSGASLDPGWQRLHGTDSLSFVRARHEVPNAVYTRTRDQGRFARESLEQYQGEVKSNPSRVQDWIHAGLAHLKTNLTLGQVMRLAGLADKIPFSRVNFVLVPTRPAQVGPYQVAFLLPSAQTIFADMRGDGLVG
jgi:LCP family protein required for cell wall assembly